MTDITVCLDDLPVIKKGYARAVRDEKESFTITNNKGQECLFLVDYAKYLIEYFEDLKKRAGL